MALHRRVHIPHDKLHGIHWTRECLQSLEKSVLSPVEEHSPLKRFRVEWKQPVLRNTQEDPFCYGCDPGPCTDNCMKRMVDMVRIRQEVLYQYL